MKRRTFGKIALTSVAGVAFSPVLSKTNHNMKSTIKLGGVLFNKFSHPEEWINLLKDRGYTAAYCPVKPGTDSATITSYKLASQRENIIISEVGAWSNPIDPDTEKSKAAINKCINSLALADEIEANCCVNISGSRNPEKWAGPHKENLTEATFDLIVETTRKIIDAVKPRHTFYTLETMPWAYPDSIESYQRLLKAIDRKQFAVHFDPVNLITSPQIYFKNGLMIKEAFKKLGKNIKSCHAKDIKLLEEAYTPHLPEVRPGLGNLNYKVFLSELMKLDNIPLMMEHLDSEEEYHMAAEFIRKTERVI